MILADFECRKGHINEHLIESSVTVRKCPTCGGRSKRIISQSGQYLGNLDAGWIRSVLDVVDKDSNKQHVREFISNPNRETYKRWMKGEGIRPLDRAEPVRPKVDYEAAKEQRDRRLMDNLMKRNRIEI